MVRLRHFDSAMKSKQLCAIELPLKEFRCKVPREVAIYDWP